MLLLFLCFVFFFLAIKHPIPDPNTWVAGDGSNLFVCSGPLEVVIDRPGALSSGAGIPLTPDLHLSRARSTWSCVPVPTVIVRKGPTAGLPWN